MTFSKFLPLVWHFSLALLHIADSSCLGSLSDLSRGLKHKETNTGLWLGMAYRFTDISVKPIYGHFLKYWLLVSVKVRTDKISTIGYRLRSNIGSKYRL